MKHPVILGVIAGVVLFDVFFLRATARTFGAIGKGLGGAAMPVGDGSAPSARAAAPQTSGFWAPTATI